MTWHDVRKSGRKLHNKKFVFHLLIMLTSRKHGRFRTVCSWGNCRLFWSCILLVLAYNDRIFLEVVQAPNLGRGWLSSLGANFSCCFMSHKQRFYLMKYKQTKRIVTIYLSLIISIWTSHLAVIRASSCLFSVESLPWPTCKNIKIRRNHNQKCWINCMFYHLNKCLILHRGTIVAQQWCTLYTIYIKSLHITLFFIKLQLLSRSRTADVGVHSQEDLIQSA